MEEDLAGRVLAFDAGASKKAAELSAKRRAQGRAIEIRDLLISGIALSRRGAIAAGNIECFDQSGVPLINRWEA